MTAETDVDLRSVRWEQVAKYPDGSVSFMPRYPQRPVAEEPEPCKCHCHDAGYCTDCGGLTGEPHP